MQQSRRAFLADVGKGMLIASVGPALAADVGLGTVWAEEAPERLTFGSLEPLVALMQETPAAKLQPMLVDRINKGTGLNQLVAAAALANARTFGGHDYIGFHTFMALSPAYAMSKELPKDRQALPVLKVLYRNASRIQETGGRANEVLKPVKRSAGVAGQPGGEGLRAIARTNDSDEVRLSKADAMFASLAQNSPEDAYNELLTLVEDGAEVHRIVLAYRAWDMLNLVGKERAETMLRQSLHYCVRAERPNQVPYYASMRAVLPKLMDQYKLAGKSIGTTKAEDGWVEKMSETIFKASTPEVAADAAAAALAEGIAPDAIGEAICLAANQLVLRDNGRPKQEAPNKPAGSVHGDGIGVHASDSANAWRNIAKVSNARNTAACLILGAFQARRDRSDRGDLLTMEPYPRADARAKITTTDPAQLLKEIDGAIREKDQARACALVAKYGETGQSARPVFDIMLRYGTSEDGALHAEKYYRTTTEEFANTRAAFRWRQVIALARVTTSEYGQPAPGYAEACKLLGV